MNASAKTSHQQTQYLPTHITSQGVPTLSTMRTSTSDKSISDVRSEKTEMYPIPLAVEMHPRISLYPFRCRFVRGPILSVRKSIGYIFTQQLISREQHLFIFCVGATRDKNRTLRWNIGKLASCALKSLVREKIRCPTQRLRCASVDLLIASIAGNNDFMRG